MDVDSFNLPTRYVSSTSASSPWNGSPVLSWLCPTPSKPTWSQDTKSLWTHRLWSRDIPALSLDTSLQLSRLQPLRLSADITVIKSSSLASLSLSGLKLPTKSYLNGVFKLPISTSSLLRRAYPQTPAISLTNLNLAHCSSSASLFSISQDANPALRTEQAQSQEACIYCFL